MDERAVEGDRAPHETLSALLRDALPDEWRHDVAASQTDGGFAVRFRDDAGRQHVLEARRCAAADPAFVRGRVLGFSYRHEDAALDVGAALAGYRAVLEAFAAREEALLPWVRADAYAPAPGDGAAEEATAFVYETDLLARAARAARLDGPAGALGRALDDLLPRGRPGALHLYFKAPCAQSCEFCEEPRVRERLDQRARASLLRVQRAAGLDLVGSGLFDALLEAAGRREPPARLVVTGHDWARLPGLDRLLDRLAREERVRVDFQGPSTRLADRALAQRLARLPTLGTVSLTLQSPEPAAHDAITGAPGSGAQVMAAVANLRELGVPVIINAVLTARGVDALPGLFAWLDRERLAVALRAFIPDAGLAGGWDAGAIMAPMDRLREALEADPDRTARVVAGLAGLPTCVVPRALRSRVLPAPLGNKREPARFPPGCEGCGLRPGCPGVPASYGRRFGARGLAPEGAVDPPRAAS